MENKKVGEAMIGKPVIVRANVAGVHAGILLEFSPETNTVLLKDAYRLWRYYTRDRTGSVSDIAANGLKDGVEHAIGTKLESVLIHNPPGFEIAEMTQKAYLSVAEWKN